MISLKYFWPTCFNLVLLNEPRDEKNKILKAENRFILKFYLCFTDLDKVAKIESDQSGDTGFLTAMIYSTSNTDALISKLTIIQCCFDTILVLTGFLRAVGVYRFHGRYKKFLQLRVMHIDKSLNVKNNA